MIRKIIKAVLIKLGLLGVARGLRKGIKLICNYLKGYVYRPYRYFYSYISFILSKKYNVKCGIEPKTISLLCPTRGRPRGVAHLISSVYRTAAIPGRVEILFYIDSDDSCKNDYLVFFKRKKFRFNRLMRCEIFLGEPVSVSKSWNILACESKGDLLVMTNDDQRYIDYGWDVRLDNEIKKFPDEIFCMWFNDGAFGAEYCTFPIVSRRWFETLEYFTPGIFEFWCNDSWIMDIAERIGRLHYIPDILAEHLNYGFKKALFDKTYQRHRPGGSDEVWLKDMALFEKTYPERKKAAKKLKTVIDNYKGGKTS